MRKSVLTILIGAAVVLGVDLIDAAQNGILKMKQTRKNNNNYKKENREKQGD